MKNSPIEHLHFICATTNEAKESKKRLIDRYGQTEFKEADALVILGGDGAVLHSIQKHIHSNKPLFGMNKGSIGFLMNNYNEDNLLERINTAQKGTIHPLKMVACDAKGNKVESLAINEVSLFRQSYQAAKIAISVDNKIRMEELICDGVMVATPAGSTAYNLSAFGPILPLMAPLMALTPISAFRPRRWHGALLPDTALVRFDMLEVEKRPVNVVADNIETKSVHSVTICTEKKISATLLFDQDHSWEERIIREQFLY